MWAEVNQSIIFFLYHPFLLTLSSFPVWSLPPTEVLEEKLLFQCGLSTGCRDFREDPSASEWRPFMCCREIPASPWSSSQATGNASSSVWGTSSFLSSDFGVHTVVSHSFLPLLLHLSSIFFLKYVFPKKQENSPVVGPIQPMGTGIHVPLPTVPLLQKPLPPTLSTVVILFNQALKKKQGRMQVFHL